MDDSLFSSECNSKLLSISCKNCERLTIIEGETICFKAGEITRLTPYKEKDSKPSLLCTSWKSINISKSA